MSMYRQLWLAIILSTLLALLGSLLASTLSARSYLAEQLYMKNMDNAAALALSLSQHEQDPVAITVATAALFDSGHYELIRVTDPLGKILIELKGDQEQQPSVPYWFPKLLPIKATPGYARISSGWKQQGDVTLVSHSRFAYQALWRSVLATIAALFAAGLLAGLLATLILRRIKQPLDDVIHQAQAISERRFITIEEPQVPELRDLAAAMNSMVGRLHSIFEEEARRLERIKHEANCDPLTGLFNREYFISALHATASDEDAEGGTLMLIRLARLGDINQRLGRPATDNLLRSVAAILTGHADSAHREGLSSRLNGTDFGLILPREGYHHEAACQLLEKIEGVLSDPSITEPAVHIGYSEFRQGTDISALLARVDGALLASEHAQDHAPHPAPQESGLDSPITQEQWRQALRHAIDNKWMRLAAFPVTDFSGQMIHHDCPLRLMFDERESWSPAGRFLPVAERLGLAPELDLAALRLALDELREHPESPGLAVNFSAHSIQQRHFRKQVRSLLDAHQEVAGKIWLDITENAAFGYLDSLQLFTEELSGSGTRIGVEHFGRRFGQVDQLYHLGLHYLKVDASFIRQIDMNTGNQDFLKGLTGIAHTIGLQVYAQGVSTQAELALLARLGFDGATGPWIKM